MKKIKYLVDLIMFIILVCLMRVSITGILWHEIFGLGIISVFVLHNLLNLKWIKAITINILKGKVNLKTKFMYILNFTLLILMILTGLSGIGISTELITNISFSNRYLWIIIHNISAYLLLAGISIHIGLHLKIIIKSIKKVFKIKDENGHSKLGKIIAIFFSIIGLITYMSDEKLKEIFNYFFTQTTETSNNTNTTTDASFQSGDKTYKLVAVSTTSSSSTSIDKLLSSTHCTGCRKRCLLSSPQCGIGVTQAKELTVQYNSSSSSSSSSNSTNSSTTKTNTVLDSSNIENNTTSSNYEETSINSQTSDDLLTKDSIPLNISKSILEMGFWIGSTYYILESIENKKKKESNN